MAKRPTLAIGRWIEKAFRIDDFNLFIVHGKPRIGKSAYAIKGMGQAIDYLWGEDIFKIAGSTGLRRAPICSKYMGWDPVEVVDTWTDLVGRIPCYTWDDAGYWLFSLNWTDPLLIAVQQYMNVVGTDMNNMVLTTPDPKWILSKIATMPGTMRVKIIKRRGGRETSDSQLYSRRALGYVPWRYPDLKGGGVNKVLEDDFSCKLPDEFYKWYKPTRERYAMRAKLAMKEELVKRREDKRRRLEKGRKRGKKSK